VLFDNGETEAFPPQKLRQFDWGVGSRVRCNYRRLGRWYAGEITALRGSTVELRYPNGEAETTLIGRCRSD
jgi:hypothetical protein